MGVECRTKSRPSVVLFELVWVSSIQWVDIMYSAVLKTIMNVIVRDPTLSQFEPAWNETSRGVTKRRTHLDITGIRSELQMRGESS